MLPPLLSIFLMPKAREGGGNFKWREEGERGIFQVILGRVDTKEKPAKETANL